MWWKFKKVSETPQEVVYAYSYESSDPSGLISYNKESALVTVLRKADTEIEAEAQSARRWMRKIAKGRGFPDMRIFAIG